MRKLGYHPFQPRHSRQVSFVRRLGQNFYPRFHVYFSPDNDFLNLHLDQKKASYQGSPAHAGEYDSEIIKQEAARINQFLKTI